MKNYFGAKIADFFLSQKVAGHFAHCAVLKKNFFMSSFQLEISSQLNPMLKVFGLRSGGMLLEKATISWIMDEAEKLYAGSHQQIILYLKVNICSIKG